MSRPDEDPASDEAKSFIEHLEDLRRMLIRCAGALMAGMLIALPLAPRILRLLKVPLARWVEDPDRFLRSLAVAGAFSSALRIAFWSGLVISAPFLVYFIGQFVFPGLKRQEKSMLKRVGGVALFLFVLGVWLGYSITLPTALGVMLRMHRWLGVQAEWTLSSYVAFSTQLLAGFGLVFELPVVVLVLGRLGVLNSTQLREKRRHVIILLLVVAMLLTPPDVLTQLMMAVPLVLLYEACIWILYGMEKSAKRRRGENES